MTTKLPAPELAGPPSPDLLGQTDAYWHALSYMSVGCPRLHARGRSARSTRRPALRTALRLVPASGKSAGWAGRLAAIAGGVRRVDPRVFGDLLSGWPLLGQIPRMPSRLPMAALVFVVPGAAARRRQPGQRRRLNPSALKPFAGEHALNIERAVASFRAVKAR